jgi:hypothetical protein
MVEKDCGSTGKARSQAMLTLATNRGVLNRFIAPHGLRSEPSFNRSPAASAREAPAHLAIPALAAGERLNDNRQPLHVVDLAACREIIKRPSGSKWCLRQASPVSPLGRRPA